MLGVWSYLVIGFAATLIVLGSFSSLITDSVIQRAIKSKLSITEDNIDDFAEKKNPTIKTICVWDYTNLNDAGQSTSINIEVEEHCYDFELRSIKYRISFEEENKFVKYWKRDVLVPISADVEQRLNSTMIVHPNLQFFIGFKLSRQRTIPQALARMDATAIANLLTITTEQSNAFLTTFSSSPTAGQNVIDYLDGYARGEPVFKDARFVATGVSELTQGFIAIFLNRLGSSAFTASAPTIQPFVTISARVAVGIYLTSEDDEEAHFNANKDKFYRSYTGQDRIEDVFANNVILGDSIYTGWQEGEIIDLSRDSSQIAPFQRHNKPEELRIWIDEAKRVTRFVPDSDAYEQTFREIKMYRYRISPESLQNEREYPPNAKYEMFKDNGLVFIGPTTENTPGAPLWLSYPHMLGVPAKAHAEIRGFSPDRSLHEPFLDYELRTGVLMRAAKRLQLNVRVEQGAMEATPYPQLFANTEAFLPLFWGDEHGAISSEDAEKFRSSIVVAEKAANIARPVLILVGVFLLMGVLVRQRRKQLAQRYDQKLHSSAMAM